MTTPSTSAETDMMDQHSNSGSNPSDSNPKFPSSDQQYVVYRRRWVVLTLYVFFCICNAMQWIQYSIIADLIVLYYGVNYAAVNWTSIIWMVNFIIFIFPATWLLTQRGIRFAILLGQALNCAGAWIKVFSVRPDLFAVTFVGQFLVSIAQVYVLGTPAAVAATWFGHDQVSTATAIGVFGLMIGNALGSVLPPLLVDEDNLEQGLRIMFWSVAIFSTILLVLIFFLTPESPPTPPSAAQAQRTNRLGIDLGGVTPMDFLRAIWKLLQNMNLCLLAIAYGMSVGVFSAIMTFLNQLIEPVYENGQDHAGYIGANFIICGLIGTIVCGLLLDKTRKYKEMCFILFAITFVGTIGFTLVLGFTLPIAILYVICSILGFVIVGYLPAGLEFAAELTYPTPEASSASVLSLSSQICSLVLTVTYAPVLRVGGSIASNGYMSAALLVGTFASAFTKSDLRRQEAEKGGLRTESIEDIVPTVES